MTTIKLNQYHIITFDGKVIEDFPGRRVHIGMLVNFDLVKDKQGKHKLYIKDIHSGTDINVDESFVVQVNKLVAQVKKAQAEFKFD